MYSPLLPFVWRFLLDGCFCTPKSAPIELLVIVTLEGKLWQDTHNWKHTLHSGTKWKLWRVFFIVGIWLSQIRDNFSYRRGRMKVKWENWIFRWGVFGDKFVNASIYSQTSIMNCGHIYILSDHLWVCFLQINRNALNTHWVHFHIFRTDYLNGTLKMNVKMRWN